MLKSERKSSRGQRRHVYVSLLKVVARMLASHTDTLAILVQQDGYGHERASKEREEGARPTDAEVAIRRTREEREAGAEHGTDKIVAGEDARGIGRIRIGEVVQDDVLKIKNVSDL